MLKGQWMFALLLLSVMSVTSASAPACKLTNSLFGMCAADGKQTYLGSHTGTPEACFDKCAVKLNTWGSSDWYFDSSDPVAESWYFCDEGGGWGPAEPSNQAKPSGLLFAELLVANDLEDQCSNAWGDSSADKNW